MRIVSSWEYKVAKASFIASWNCKNWRFLRYDLVSETEAHLVIDGADNKKNTKGKKMSKTQGNRRRRRRIDMMAQMFTDFPKEKISINPNCLMFCVFLFFFPLCLLLLFGHTWGYFFPQQFSTLPLKKKPQNIFPSTQEASWVVAKQNLRRNDLLFFIKKIGLNYKNKQLDNESKMLLNVL